MTEFRRGEFAQDKVSGARVEITGTYGVNGHEYSHVRYLDEYGGADTIPNHELRPVYHGPLKQNGRLR